MKRRPYATPIIALMLLAAPIRLQAAATVWNFDASTNRFAAASGSGTLLYHDPDADGWGPTLTEFGKASSFGLPTIDGADPDVMRFPACTARQGYRVVHGGAANGPYGETAGRVSNYTVIMDVLFSAASDGRWRALYQTETNNTTDAEFYVQNAVAGGIGTINVYNGSIPSNSWHRIAIVMQSAPGEGKCQRFIDGRFVGGIGSTGSGLDSRWALDRALLLFTDGIGGTASGFVSSIQFVDRALKMEEVEALGGPNAAGADVPGAPAPPIAHQMPRRVGVIGHRGGFFCCAPDNTLAAVRRAITNQTPVIEIDTRLSADGVCVLMHDSTVERTTDGTGAVASMTVAQLKQLDAGSWFSPEFAGERIPTLVEVMAEARGKLILYFDLKVPGQIDAITNAIGQTGFNPDDCWFWTYDSVSDAASIRSRLPNAKMIWDDPPGTWATDPNYSSSLRTIGVWGFDLGVYYGTVNGAFLRAAKREGFMVSIYTILDPDTMVRNAAAGVDFMETDFPQIMREIQPPQFDAASNPRPANGAVNVTPNPLLTWVVGSNATTHRVYFGADPAPPLLGEQTYDIATPSNLAAGATYYWRVDEVGSGGMAPGPVWSFTVATTPPPTNRVYEWTFDDGDLSAALGNGVMDYADNATALATTFGVTDGAALPQIAGQPARYMHVPALTATANGYKVSLTGSEANGGGAYINRFTFIADVLVPGSLNWTPLFNTNPDNANDADFYIDPTGRLGIAALGYAPAGTITPNNWYRIAFVADLGAGLVTYYVNGDQVFQRTGASLLDGRFSLYSDSDPGPDLLLFNEGDTSGVYTHELYASSIALADWNLSASEIGALGAPRAEGIFVQRLRVARSGGDVSLRWAGAPNVLVQSANSLSNPIWQAVPGTLGASSHSERASTNAAFYRLLRQ